MDLNLQQLIQEWLKLDPNQDTRREIQDLVEAGNLGELEKRMRPRIAFGTAGLRARMEAGWSRMNDLIVVQTSQGLCAYALKVIVNTKTRGVVIGHDHRHNSERWAELAAAAFIRHGVKVYLHQGLVHTPLVPFTVKRLNAACGIMITASHNPKQDNGFKVYWENGVQIVEPHDNGISTSIQNDLNPQDILFRDVRSHPLCIDQTDVMRDAYFDTLSGMITSRSLNAASSIRFVNTSLHGVSDSLVKRAFEDLGLPSYIPVVKQQAPDPEFPTIKFPNPEEKGSLDLAIETANKEGASYVLAQDPDADRFAAAERRSDGRWVVFTGDQLGSIFASHCLDTYKKSGRPMEKFAIVASVVSSKMIEAMAQAEGFEFVACLTGFKFIGNTAITLVQRGFEVPFGYEEAVGYMFGSDIRDKDGVAATVVFAQLAILLQSQGQTVMSYLEDLYKRYGFFETRNGYYICHDPHTIDKIFARLRMYNNAGPTPNYPRAIAGFSVVSVTDLTTGYADPPSIEPKLPRSPGHMVQFRARNETINVNVTLTLRTSGTEPKIKYYLEGSGKSEEEICKLLPLLVNELGDRWLEATKNGLVHGQTATSVQM